MQSKNDFIEFMISANVLRFGDFVTKSGRNTPYFVNTGNYSTGAQLMTLGRFYADLVNRTCPGGSFDALFGPAYKGIPLVSSVAVALYNNYKLDKPYFFNRKEAKDHGEGGLFIGYNPAPKDKIIVIEDVITAGTAIRDVIKILKPLGVEVTDMFISVDRCEKGYNGKTAVAELREEFGIQVHSLISITNIINYLTEKGHDKEMIARMREYMEQYCNL